MLVVVTDDPMNPKLRNHGVMIAIAITRVVLRLILLIEHNSARSMAIHTTAVVWGRR
jgi:hypothetical protein